MAQVILNLTDTVQDEYNSLSDDDKRLIVAQSGLDDLAFEDIFDTIRNTLLVGIEYDDDKAHKLYMTELISMGQHPNLDEELFDLSYGEYSAVTALEFLGEYE